MYILISSCNGGGLKIRNADKIHIFFPLKNGVVEYIDSSKKIIADFRRVLNGKVEQRKCPTEGEIRFMMRDSLLLEGGISFKEANCQYFMIGEKAWKLNYNAGQYLSETFYQLTNK